MNRFVVCDPARCIGCGACLVTCSESHRKRWMRPAARLSLAKTRTVTAAVTCHQCEGAPCMAVCPEAAISLVRDHVHIDEELCTGCLLCALACPFGAVYPSAPSDAPAKATPYGLSLIHIWPAEGSRRRTHRRGRDGQDLRTFLGTFRRSGERRNGSKLRRRRASLPAPSSLALACQKHARP